MKLTLKTVTGVNFSLDAEPSDTIGSVKSKVEADRGAEAFPAAHMMIVFQGKVLKDDTTVADNKITEAGFLVCLVQKPKAAPAAAAPAPTPTPEAPTPAAEAPAAPAAAATAAAAEAGGASAVAAGGVPAAAFLGESALVAGSQLDSMVAQIMEMGFEKEQVQRAMRAAFNNPDRAIEYLMSGIPETAEPPAPVAAPTPAAAAAAPTAAAPTAPAAATTGPNTQPLNMFAPQPAAAGGGAGGGEGEGQLGFLRNNSQFQVLLQMVQQNPQILQPMLHELGKANPHLLELINANQEEFLRLINEPPPEGGIPNMAEMAAQMMGGGPEPGEQLEVTEEEKAAIERLTSMGFDRNLAIQAFFACDKNETLAANYLIEHAGEFDD